jgi:hypothetical protein
MRDNFVTDILELPPHQMQEDFAQEARALYGKLEGQPGDIKYAMENVKNYFDEIGDDLIASIKGKGKKSKKSFFNMIKRELGETGAIEWDKIQNMSANKWGGKYSSLKPEEKRLWMGFQDALDKDLLKIDEVADVHLGRLLKKADALFKSSADAKKAKRIENLFDGALKNIEGTEYLQPKIFKRKLNKAIPGLQKAGFSKERIQLLRKFADRIQVAQPDFEKFVKSTSPASMIGKMFKLGLPAGTDIGRIIAGKGAMFADPLLAVPVGAETIFAYSLMKPKGWVRRWLTTGFAPGLGTKALLKESLKPVPQLIRDINQNDTEGQRRSISPQQFITR